jgi:catechol 2,3-dioxygenase-like lactoylglutathione lyase family enzyme
MAVQGLARITVSVEDLDRALALYRDALGLVEQYRQGDVAMLAIAGVGGPQVLLHARAPQPSMAGVAASLRVDDVDEATAAAVAAGALVLDPPGDQPWGERQSVLTDADGHVLCLVSATRDDERPGT